MSFLLKALAKASEDAEEKTESGIMALLDKAQALAEESLSAEQALLAAEGLGKIRARSGDLAFLGASRLTAAISYHSISAEDAAYLLFLEGEATFEERRNAMHASIDATAANTQRVEESWGSFRELMEDLGKLALKVLPLLLAA